MGPVTIDAPVGSCTFVPACGPDAPHAKLLVLPVAS